MRVIDKVEERSFILECLTVYKSLPALWNTKTPEYRNKHEKNVAYQTLVNKFREKYANITRKDVTRKINTLRTNFRKEVKRLEDEGREETKLWYYEHMKFLRDQADIKEEIQFFDEDQCSFDPISIEIVQQADVPVKRKHAKVEDTPSESYTQRTSVDDVYELRIAQTWAMELKKMAPDQQIHAKKAINEILYEGQLGNLHRDCVHIYSP